MQVINQLFPRPEFFPSYTHPSYTLLPLSLTLLLGDVIGYSAE